MGLLDRISRVVRANLTSLVNRAEDPERVLAQTVLDMQEDLIQLRQAVAQAIATQKRCERQQRQAAALAGDWQQRAQRALQQGDEPLAREALVRRQSYLDTAQSLQAQLTQQRSVIAKLKQTMRELEAKLDEAKTRKDLYIARARAAQASQSLNEMLGRTSSSRALGAFERMEERVHQLEAEAEALSELSQGDDLEKRFAALEQGDGIDQQLAALKNELLAGSEPGQLPEGSAGHHPRP